MALFMILHDLALFPQQINMPDVWIITNIISGVPCVAAADAAVKQQLCRMSGSPIPQSGGQYAQFQ